MIVDNLAYPPLSKSYKLIVRSVLKDFFEGHVLKNFSEIKKACRLLFERKGLEKLSEKRLETYIILEGKIYFDRDPRTLQERSYKERIRPRNFEEGARAHYTAAERNFTQKILKTNHN